MNVSADRQRPRATTPSSPPWASATARAGWVVLLVIAILGGLNHLLGALTFATDGEERMMFALFAGVNAYAIAVLLSAYRRHETWAWSVTWLQVAAFAAVLPLLGGGLGLGYLVIAAIAGFAQLATLPHFRRGPAARVVPEGAPG